MEPYRYLVNAARQADDLKCKDEITKVIDELELLYEALDPELQDQAGDLIQRLTRRRDEP